MKDVKVILEAEEELFEAALYYEGKQTGLGLDFKREIERSFELIANAPLLWGKRYKNYRRYLLKRFPFEIWYEDMDSFIRVLAISHQKRRPYYWRNRGSKSELQ